MSDKFKFSEDQRKAIFAGIASLLVNAVTGRYENSLADNLIDRIESIISERDGWIDVEVIQDGDGHWYVIPKSKRTLWDAHIQNIEREEDESDEWYTAIEAFDKEFGEHMTGGDINLIQLYIKQPKK